MCIAVHPNDACLVCGVNEEAPHMVDGNQHLRTFAYEATTRPAARAEARAELAVTIRATQAKRSLEIRDPEHYQKTATFSPDGALLAVGSSDGKVQLHRYPSFEPVWSTPADVGGGKEVYDTDFSQDGTQLLVATASKLAIVSTAPKTVEVQGAVQTTPRVLQTIEGATIGSLQGAFRAAKFGRSIGGVGTRDRVYALVNAAAPKGAKARASYVATWDADAWKLLGARKVASRPGTVLAVSPNGRLVAVGTSDLCISVLQARTLRPLLKATHVHDFPPTCLAFSPNSRAMVSGSADSTVRLQVLPHGLLPKLGRSPTRSCSPFRRADFCRVFHRSPYPGRSSCSRTAVRWSHWW